MTDAELTQLLQDALNTDQIVLQAKRKDPHIMIMLNRDPDLGAVDHDALADWFKTALLSLQDPKLTTLALYSREKGKRDPDWQARIPLVNNLVSDGASQKAAGSRFPSQAEADPADRESADHESQDRSSARPTMVAPLIHPDGSSVPESLDLSAYKFTRNDLLIRTSGLKDPHESVKTLVKVFHDLSSAEKQFVLPRMEAFLKDPAAIEIDPAEMTGPVRSWLQQIQHLDEKYLKDFAIWLSRYCYDSDKTLRELGALQPDLPTQADPNPDPKAEAGSPGGSAAQSSRIRGATESLPKASRAAQIGLPLKVASFAGNLALASGVTLALLAGMVLVLTMAVLGSVSDGGFGLGWLVVSVVITLAFNAIFFLIGPWIMDLTQKWLYGTEWIPLDYVAQRSPETADMIQRVCAKHRIKEPKLGLIRDQNPTAFTYGNFPNSARLVVSEGLFTYLDDDEVATVYAHEIGHIVHWDFAVMTLASTLVQITYLLYVFLRERVRGDSKAARNIRNLATVAYVFYIVGTYLVLYLSRVREYFADHFAAEVTGNPNALSRALVKIAYGIVQEGERQESNEEVTARSRRLLEGTRALGISDARSATASGTAYRVAARPDQVGKVFLWDMFNPWGGWMELNSTHPLTGKRVRALSTYAEQLGIPAEFDMAKVIRKGKELDKGRLYGGFAMDVALMNAPWIGGILGFLGGIALTLGSESSRVITVPVGLILLGASLGLMVKMTVMFPRLVNLVETNVLRAMSNPYASPLRGIPIQIEGKLIGRGNAGYVAGSELKMQDPTGMILLRYSSRFGPIGNFFFGASKVSGLIGRKGSAVGWFRRGIAPMLDLSVFSSNQGDRITSHPAFWYGCWVIAGVLAGLFFLVWW